MPWLSGFFFAVSGLYTKFTLPSPPWPLRPGRHFPGWRNEPDYFSWEPPLAWIYAGDAAIPKTLNKFLAALALELKRAGFKQVVPAVPRNADITATAQTTASGS
jgi:hypothetical protein